MNNIKLIIPMSGWGTRFLSAGYRDPKPLIDIDGYPMIKYVVDLFPEIEDIIFVCRKEHLEETNMKEILLGIKPLAKIIPVKDVFRKGPVDAVFQIKDHIDDDKEIIVSYCDYGSQWDFRGFLQDCKTRNLDGSIPCYTGFHPHMLGSDNYAFCKENLETGLVEKIKEKEPFTDNKMNEWASNGTYYFRTGKILKKYFEKLIERDIHLGGEYYVSLVYNLLINDGLNVTTFLIEKMLQWGTPYDLENYKWWSDYFNKIKNPTQKIKHPKNTTLILPMAGKGSRFSEFGYDLPKPLLPINNNIMVVEAVNSLPETENKVFICLDEHVKKYMIDEKIKKTFNQSKVVIIDDVTEGQACTCEIAIKKLNLNLNNPIVISACDNGVYFSSEKYQKLLDDENVDVIVWSFRNNQTSKLNPNSYAWLEVDNDDNINYVSCKNFIYDDPLKTHAIIGTMFFRKASYFIDGLSENYKSNIRTNNEFYVDDVINQCIKQGLKVKVFESENYICWGTPNDYKTYNYWNEFFKK